jgi:hypothetical protein
MSQTLHRKLHVGAGRTGRPLAVTGFFFAVSGVFFFNCPPWSCPTWAANSKIRRGVELIAFARVLQKFPLIRKVAMEADAERLPIALN